MDSSESPPKKKAGRKPAFDLNTYWRMRELIRNYGFSISAAAWEIVRQSGNEEPNSAQIDTLRRRYNVLTSRGEIPEEEPIPDHFRAVDQRLRQELVTAKEEARASLEVATEEAKRIGLVWSVADLMDASLSDRAERIEQMRSHLEHEYKEGIMKSNLSTEEKWNRYKPMRDAFNRAVMEVAILRRIVDAKKILGEWMRFDVLTKLEDEREK
jgi:hypothetical protein